MINLKYLNLYGKELPTDVYDKVMSVIVYE